VGWPAPPALARSGTQATQAAQARKAPDAVRATLTRFLDAIVARDAEAARALATDELRAQSPGALVGVSNPCAYRYAVVALTPARPDAMAARVRIYQHYWPGDVGGGLPTSFEQDVGVVQTAAGWRVGRLGPEQNTRAEPGEPHGPTTSACTAGRRPGVWLAATGALPATGAGLGGGRANSADGPAARLAAPIALLLLSGGLLMACRRGRRSLA
jgi:hypothetical protein